MAITKKFLLVIGIVFGGIIVAGSVFSAVNAFSGTKLTLLSNEGVMIESKGYRIYIDPIYFPPGYTTKPADCVMVTHPHTDHYQASVIEDLQKEGTINIFPENMSDAIALFDGIGMVPEDVYNLTDEITVTAFYEYTIPDGIHPKNANWTSYLIDFNGFTIFHAGDSGNIVEYEQLTGLVDVAMLPYVPNFLMTEMEIVDAFNTIQPQYAMLIHASYLDYTGFQETYADQIDATFLAIEPFTSHKF